MGNLCYRSARDGRDRLGQFATPPRIADLLVAMLPRHDCEPVNVLDLGAGAGALSAAFNRSRAIASCTLLEIDDEFVGELENLPIEGEKHIIQADFLSDNWTPAFPADVVLSNPPYGSIELDIQLEASLEDAGLTLPMNGRWVRTESLFLARAWSVTSPGSLLGFIVTEPLLHHASFAHFRQNIVCRLQNLSVTKLDPVTFQGAEVSAYLLAGRRALSRRRRVLLRRADLDGEIVDELSVSHKDAVSSLDIDYHKVLQKLSLSVESAGITLGDLDVSIHRGSRSRKQFLELGIKAFHTTDFPAASDEVVLRGGMVSDCRSAESGDILIPRVGTRCMSKRARVARGSGLFTDCVYKISAGSVTQKKIWNTVSSDFGAEWRQASALGSCAKHLPISTLRKMPLLS